MKPAIMPRPMPSFGYTTLSDGSASIAIVTCDVYMTAAEISPEIRSSWRLSSLIILILGASSLSFSPAAAILSRSSVL